MSIQARKLKQSPIRHVLAQIMISPVLKMKDYIPELQEELRKKGFPKYYENSQAGFDITPNGIVQPRTSIVWEFLTRTHQRSLLITENSLVFQACHYETFEEFKETLSSLLDVVNTKVGIDLRNRLGLRYINLFQPSTGETIDAYLDHGLLGFPMEQIQLQAASVHSQTLAGTPLGSLMVRVLRGPGKMVWPPDIPSFNLKYPAEIPADEMVSVLDLDHYNIEEKDFVCASLLNEITALHDKLEEAFLVAVSKHALQTWGAD